MLAPTSGVAAEPADGAVPYGWNDDACLQLLWQLRFSVDGEHAQCAKCGRVRRFHRLRGRRAFVCDTCGTQIYPTSATVFARSRIPLSKWFEVLALIGAKGRHVDELHLNSALGLKPEKTERLVLRLREALAGGDDEAGLLRRIAEIRQHEPNAWLADIRSSERTDGDVEDRRAVICQAACATIASNGLNATRIQDIADAAGTSTATVHYYFASKDDVLTAALRWAGSRIDRSLRESDGSALVRLGRVLELALPTAGFLREEYRLWLEIWIRAGNNPSLVQECNQISAAWFRSVRDIVVAGADAGEFRPIADVDEIVERLIALANGLGFKAAVGYPGMEISRMRILMIRFTAEQLTIPVDDLDRIVQPLLLT